MLDGLVHIAILRVDLRKLLMSFTRLRLVVGLLAQLEEFVQKFYRFVKVAKHLVDVTNFLVAFSLLVSIFGTLRGVQAFLEKL
jgi:hypothetical protein